MKYLALLAATIALGLAVRWPGVSLPGWFTKPAGDVLYATAAYWGWRLVLPLLWRRAGESGADFRGPLVATLVSCAAIEFLKLCQAPWLVAVRGSGLGRLVFGVGFHWENLIYYLAGALLAVGCERLMRAPRQR